LANLRTVRGASQYLPCSDRQLTILSPSMFVAFLFNILSSFSCIKAGAHDRTPAIAIYAIIDWLGQGDVARLHALLATGRLVGDLGTLVEGLEPVTRYAAVVNEEIVATLIRADKAVAFIVVEPLNRSLGHMLEPTFLVSEAPPQ
jgi:hypothetical protein